GSASYNVIPVEGGYLLMEYYLSDGGAARVAGCEGSIPVSVYDGRKIAYNKSGKGKSNKSSKESLRISVALVKYEGGTATKVPGVTVKSAKIDAKAIKNASVSQSQIPVKVNDVTDHWEYPLLGSATLPTFTFAVKAAGDAKSFNKVLKTALKDKKYPFAIRQIGVTVDLVDGDGNGYNPWAKNGDSLISNGTLSGNFPDEAFYYFYGVEYESGVAFTNNTNYGVLKITKVTAKGGALSMLVDTWNGKKADVAEVTFKAKTDYTFTAGTVGGETVQVLDFPENSNIRYVDTDNTNTLAGNGYKYAFRPGVNDKKKVRQGIFKADSNGFVFSED
ncbi:MAG: hypothetical protein J5537_07555, partial [Lachnospiraceae bacterium]|nr:hypothetical protein [Lachnospiraceae bacterium]